MVYERDEEYTTLLRPNPSEEKKLPQFDQEANFLREKDHPPILAFPDVKQWYNWIVLQFYLADQESIKHPTGPPRFKEMVVLLFINLSMWFGKFYPVDTLIPVKLLNALHFSQSIHDHIGTEIKFNIEWLVIPMFAVVFILKESPSKYGLTFRGLDRHWQYYAIMMLFVYVLVWIFSFTSAFQRHYPTWKNAGSWSQLLIWEFIYLLSFFSLEFFYRGFIIHGLKERYGSGVVVIMAIPYMMIHFRKPFAECMSSFIGGTVLGLMSLRTGSIFGGVLVHMGIATSCDFACIIQTAYWRRPPNLKGVIANGYKRIPYNDTKSIRNSFHDPRWLSRDVYENEIIIFIYVGSLDSIVLTRYIFHENAGGNVLTRRLFNFIVLEGMSTAQLLCLAFMMVSLLIVFGLELRRIYCPEFEEERQKWKFSTVVLLLLNACMLGYVAVIVLKMDPDINLVVKSIMRLQNAEKPVPETRLTNLAHDAWKNLDMMFNLDSIGTGLLGISALLLNFLWLYYLTMFLPKSAIVNGKKIATPVFMFLVVLFITIWGFSMLFYAMYSDQSKYYGTSTESFISVCFFAMGRVADWNKLLDRSPVMTFLMSLVTFITFAILMRYFMTAIFVSYQRDVILRNNAQNHPMWPQQKYADAYFNPALPELDWQSKRPKEKKKNAAEE